MEREWGQEAAGGFDDYDRCPLDLRGEWSREQVAVVKVVLVTFLCICVHSDI